METFRQKLGNLIMEVNTAKIKVANEMVPVNHPERAIKFKEYNALCLLERDLTEALHNTL